MVGAWASHTYAVHPCVTHVPHPFVYHGGGLTALSHDRFRDNVSGGRPDSELWGQEWSLLSGEWLVWGR